MQISNSYIPNLPTPKAQQSTPKAQAAKADAPEKAFPGQEAFHQRLADIQQNRDLHAALAEHLGSKGILA